MFCKPVPESLATRDCDASKASHVQSAISHVSRATSEELNEIERAGAASTLSSDVISSKGHIEDIIELKMLVANQQATIDTLSSKLHNLELANRHSFEKEHEDKARLQSFEDENRILARALDRCMERELGLRNELKLQRQQIMQRKLESNGWHNEMEKRNQELIGENLELRRLLKMFQGSHGSTALGIDAVPDGIAVTSHNKDSSSMTEDHKGSMSESDSE